MIVSLLIAWVVGHSCFPSMTMTNGMGKFVGMKKKNILAAMVALGSGIKRADGPVPPPAG
jgi:hypothetical protein